MNGTGTPTVALSLATDKEFAESEIIRKEFQKVAEKIGSTPGMNREVTSFYLCLLEPFKLRNAYCVKLCRSKLLLC